MIQNVFKLWSRDQPAGRSPLDDGLGITIRFAYRDDESGLKRLAALDSQPPLAGRQLVAEVDGELWAAVSLTGEPRAIADPFRPTAELVALLRERAERLAHRGREDPVATPTATAHRGREDPVATPTATVTVIGR